MVAPPMSRVNARGQPWSSPRDAQWCVVDLQPLAKAATPPAGSRGSRGDAHQRYGDSRRSSCLESRPSTTVRRRDLSVAVPKSVAVAGSALQHRCEVPTIVALAVAAARFRARVARRPGAQAGSAAAGEELGTRDVWPLRRGLRDSIT